MRLALWRLANRIRRAFGRPLQPKWCCRVEGNLVDRATGRDDLSIKVCKVCGARHFTVTVDPGKLGVSLKGL